MSCQYCNPYCGKCRPPRERPRMCPSCSMVVFPEQGDLHACPRCGANLPEKERKRPAFCHNTGLVCANPCGKAKTPNPGKNYLACGWHTPVEKKARRPQAHEETERSQEKRCGMCFRPTAVEGGTICPNCGEQLSIPPGVNMSKCPLCGGALPDLNDPPAPGAPGAPRAAAPQAPGSPGAPAAPKAPSAPEPPTA